MTFIYLIATVFMALFGAIYEHFSHEVYSYYMIYAFALPLMLGVLPGFIIGLFDFRIPTPKAYRLWNYGVATLTVGSAFKGVLDIYGTTNRLVYVYPIAGGILLVSAMVIHAFRISSFNTTS